MKQYKAFRFCIYPNKEQEILISKTFGCCRFVYNHFLALWQNTYQSVKKGFTYNQCAKELPKLKKTYPWLKEIDSIALQSSLKDLADAYDRFFKKQNGYPKFKSKKNPVQSYTTKMVNNNIEIIGNRIKLPKLGTVRFAKSREVDGKIIKATIRRNPSGRYFISIVAEVDINPFPSTGSAVGIDMGLIDFVIASNGERFPHIRSFKRLEAKLAKEQRILARRREQAIKDNKPLHLAKNYQKQKIKVAKIYEKMANIRNDYFHKLSTYLVKSHDLIGVESLHVKNMLKNHHLAKSIQDASWHKFIEMLKYKAEWYGKKVIEVDAFFPSSQLCSVCGAKNQQVKDLSIREWTCSVCGSHHDRDINSAINIKNEALKIYQRTVGTMGIAY
jgi:putative transposase